jgi:hypothetical protein
VSANKMAKLGYNAIILNDTVKYFSGKGKGKGVPVFFN